MGRDGTSRRCRGLYERVQGRDTRYKALQYARTRAPRRWTVAMARVVCQSASQCARPRHRLCGHLARFDRYLHCAGGAQARRSPQGRVPRDPRARAPQPACAHTQRAAHPASPGRHQQRSAGARHDGAADQSHGAARRRPHGGIAHHARSDRSAQGAGRPLHDTAQRARDQPAADRAGRAEARPLAAERAQGGLGIGLALVRSLVQMHGGTVEARSDGLGKGSEFVVRLPLAIERAPYATRDAQPSPEMFLSYHILVVDDNRDVADSLGILLRLLGAKTHVVHDGPAALAAIETFKPGVVLLDLGMPGMSGYEVARRIRRQYSAQDIMLIALTGWGQDEDRRRARLMGFDYHLTKPADIKSLQECLSHLQHP